MNKETRIFTDKDGNVIRSKNDRAHVEYQTRSNSRNYTIYVFTFIAMVAVAVLIWAWRDAMAFFARNPPL